MAVNIPRGYYRTIQGVTIDPYKILIAYDIKNPCQQQAIKKLLRMGHSHKGFEQELDEAISILERWREIIEEIKDGI